MKKALQEGKFLQGGPPTSVVLATCVDAEGNPNIITLGMFMYISQRPPQVCIGVAPPRYSHDLIVGQVVAGSADTEALDESGNLVLTKARPVIQKNWNYHTVKKP